MDEGVEYDIEPFSLLK
jgi:hypothetical protein